MRGQTYIISALVFALIVAIFAVINVDPVEVNYLFTTGEAPLILVILISVLMGGLITGGFGIFHLLRLQREMKILKEENEKLRINQPVEDIEITEGEFFETSSEEGSDTQNQIEK